MPSPKTKADSTTGNWALADEVDEIRGKYHLKKKDVGSYLEISKSIIRLNEKIIAFLRIDNRNKHILLAEGENGDEHVIETVFKDERKDRLALQRCTAAEAMDEMDQKVCETERFLNALRYERQIRERRLLEVQEDLARMRSLEQKGPDQLELDPEMTRLENKLDKANVKYNTARMISQRYVDILEGLKEDSLTMPAKMDAMEGALLQEKTELQKLHEMCNEAMISRDESKKELGIIEHAAYQAKRARDAELTGTRKDVERRKAEAERVDRKANRLTLVQEHPDQKVVVELQQKRENQSRILAFEEAVEKIKMATHVADTHDVVERMTTQVDTQTQLREQVQALETQTSRTREEGVRLTALFHHMKYSGEQKLSRGERLLEEMQDHINREESKMEKLSNKLEPNGAVLISIRTGVTTLLEKLNCVKLKPPNHNYTQGDIFEQLDLCRKKLDQLLKDLKFGSGRGRADDGQSSTASPDSELQEFVEGQLSPDNVRIKIEQSETMLAAEFNYDGQENEVLSRNDIKKQGQKLIDSKHKPKKKPKK